MGIGKHKMKRRGGKRKREPNDVRKKQLFKEPRQDRGE
jgi:hypothetical protein